MPAHLRTAAAYRPHLHTALHDPVLRYSVCLVHACSLRDHATIIGTLLLCFGLSMHDISTVHGLFDAMSAEPEVQASTSGQSSSQMCVQRHVWEAAFVSAQPWQEICQLNGGLALCRERAAGYFAVYPFALAQALIEMPYICVQSILYSCITYFMTYFFIDAGPTGCIFYVAVKLHVGALQCTTNAKQQVLAHHQACAKGSDADDRLHCLAA